MTVATVLNATLTDATSYASAVLTVDTYVELAVDITISSHTGGHYTGFIINRIGADSNEYFVANTESVQETGQITTNIGAGLNNASFGDQIIVRLNNPGGDTISGTISIKGKT